MWGKRGTARWSWRLGGLLLGFVALEGSVAVADIPDGNVISTCRNTTTGSLRVIDRSAGQRCMAGEARLDWANWRWSGRWSSTLTYRAADVVFYLGSSYVDRVAPPVGTVPTSGTYWSLVASKGAIGPRGFQGPQGVRGPTGATGPQGAVGVTGPRGIQGVIGATGPAGVDGVAGATGAPGVDGAIGATGPRGVQGPIGATGPPGLDGVDGVAGATGTPGVDGVDGVVGPTGPRGVQGPIGATGPQGIQGVDGATGPQGVPGLAGATGAANGLLMGGSATLSLLAPIPTSPCDFVGIGAGVSLASTCTSAALTQVPMPVSGTVNALYVSLSGAGGSNQKLTFAVRKNGVADPATNCTPSGPSVTTCHVTGVNVPFSAGDLFDLQVSANQAAASAVGIVTWSVQYQ
jgi:hypothetical protein